MNDWLKNENSCRYLVTLNRSGKHAMSSAQNVFLFRRLLLNEILHDGDF